MLAQKVHANRTEKLSTCLAFPSFQKCRDFTDVRCVFHMSVPKFKRGLTLSTIIENLSRNIIEDIIDLLNKSFSTLS